MMTKFELSVLVVAITLGGSPCMAVAAPVFCMKGKKISVRDGSCKRREIVVGLPELSDLNTLRSDLSTARSDLGAAQANLGAVQTNLGTLTDRVATIENGLVRLPPLKLLNGQSQTFFQAGPLTLTARCTINDAMGEDTAAILISTTQDHATFDASDEADDLLIATAEADRQFAVATGTPTGTPEVENQEATAAAPDGTFFTGEIIIGVNVLNSPGMCTFAGHLRLN